MASFISTTENSSATVVLGNVPQGLQKCTTGGRRVVRHSRTRPLSAISDLRVQQGLIIKDILFALLGHESGCVRYKEKFDGFLADQKVHGPDFKVAKHLDVSLKTIAKRLMRLGTQYCGIQGFLELYDMPKYGRVVQRLCHAISVFVVQYQLVIRGLEALFKTDPWFSLSAMDTQLTAELDNKLLHLYEIAVEIHVQTAQRQLEKASSKDPGFANFIRGIQEDLQQTGNIDFSTDSGIFDHCKGTLVLKIVQGRINAFKGDAILLEFLQKLFYEISIDYVAMLNKWLQNGDIDDPFDEFLIKQNQLLDNVAALLHSGMEKYWDELYMVRTDGLIDQFMSRDMQLKILSTGKFINIFKSCTGLDNLDNLNEVLKPINNLNAQDLELKITQFYRRANKLLMKLIFEGYNFTGLVERLQSDFLFRDAFKIDKFIDRSFLDLKRNKHSIATSRLIKSYKEIFHRGISKFSVVDVNRGIESDDTDMRDILSLYQSFSVDSTNFYDLAKEILNVKSFDAQSALRDDPSSRALRTLLNQALERSQVQSSDSSVPKSQFDPEHSDEYTVSALNLDMNLPFPLNLIMTENFVFEYQLIFKLQMIIKFISKFMDVTWKEINTSTVWKYTKFDLRIKKWILRSRSLHGRMKDFMNEIEFYFNYSIIETNYSSLRDVLANIELSLAEETLGSDVDHIDMADETPGYRQVSANFNSNNSVFDEKILARGQKFSSRQNSAIKRGAEDFIDVHYLSTNLGSFLNNILKDALITDRELIEALKAIFDVVLSYNNNLSRLKKLLIMLDETLFNKFKKDYPKMFENRQIDSESIESRLGMLDEILNSHFVLFNDSLTGLIVRLRKTGDVENQLFVGLVERLEQCFPDK